MLVTGVLLSLLPRLLEPVFFFFFVGACFLVDLHFFPFLFFPLSLLFFLDINE
jgi:hypothetical protein